MKYLKKYEQKFEYDITKFKKNDYIYINNKNCAELFPECQIIEVHRNYYDIEIFYENGDLINFILQPSKIEILRKLTPKEIEEFEIKKESSKYNL